jgi:hypothetical protein
MFYYSRVLHFFFMRFLISLVMTILDFDYFLLVESWKSMEPNLLAWCFEGVKSREP